jgi:hypothetical protein
LTILVTYLSVTGNTKMVAKSIYDQIERRKEMLPMYDVDSLDGYDLIFIGFPIHSGAPPAEVREFLERYAHGRNVALFYTHAFYEDPTRIPGSVEMIGNVHENVRRAAVGAILVGTYDCQGELAENVASKFLRSPDPMIQQYGRMRHLTMGYPSAYDLSKAKLFAQDVIAKNDIILRKKWRICKLIS